MKNISYNIILQPEKEGGFTVIVPALPGCVTYGRTLDEARRMSIDAIQVYLKSARKHGERPPLDRGNFITSVNVTSAAIS